MPIFAPQKFVCVYSIFLLLLLGPKGIYFMNWSLFNMKYMKAIMSLIWLSFYLFIIEFGTSLVQASQLPLYQIRKDNVCVCVFYNSFILCVYVCVLCMKEGEKRVFHKALKVFCWTIYRSYQNVILSRDVHH